MSVLPMREMVLYKHGVGFFVRGGAVSGSEVALTFKRDEINDVLKSLIIFDRAGGHVLGIDYQTPMDKVARLGTGSIKLSDKASLRDLLLNLRGRQVSLSFEITPGTLETVSGHLVGIDQPAMLARNDTNDPPGKVVVLLLANDGQVRVFDLYALRAVSIQDTQSEHDLRYFLETQVTEDERRPITLRLNEGEHDLVVQYVAPSPIWRVSYRVVAESEQGTEAGKLILQGWGLFDNRLEEDLENVRVTLVAGQPISFIYELYASRIPDRPTVQDESRIAPGHVEFMFGLAPKAQAADDIRELRGLDKMRVRPGMYVGGGFSPDLDESEEARADTLYGSLSAEEASASVTSGTEMQETGEFFQYVVTSPVSVKRGESALVPILSTQATYQRELLYNGAKLPDHPVAALRFMNTSGLTLERGPVTVIEDGNYKGEAVVPFTKGGNEIYLPYAVELGVRIVERPEHRREIAGLNIEGAYLIFTEYDIFSTTYVIENTLDDKLTILIEAPIQTGLEPFETPSAVVETATERRWQVTASAQARTEFVRKERRSVRRRQELRRLDYRDLQRFLNQHWLDRAIFDQLSELLDSLALIQRATVEKDALATERKTLYEQQEQLRANLGALQATGKEAGLRDRMLGQLELTQNRLETIEQRAADLVRQIAETEEHINQIIAALS